MFKLMITIIGFLFINNLYAQTDTTLFNAKKTITTTSVSSSKKVLSPGEFSSRVAQVSMQNHQDFQKQLQEKLTQLPPPTIQSSSKPSIPQTLPTTAAATQPTAAQPAPVQPTAPPQKEIYTGFGNGTPPPSKAQPTSNEGWGVRY